MITPTAVGGVRGVEELGVRRFLGIPYAAAPYGARRFAVPEPVEASRGAIDATTFGPTPPQLPYDGALREILPSVVVPGDNVLNLNIWTPAEPSAVRQAEPASSAGGYPVMVWIPGGALTRGSNALPLYEGHAFARDGVVLVSINYRLGAEGFSVLDDAPVNLGLADQFAALRWVRDHIGAFGGDAARVTVFGQSAGAGCVAALLAHPEAPTLFARAILQSPAIGASPHTRARRITAAMAKDLGIATTRAAFAAVGPDELVACQHRVAKGSSLGGGPAFELVAEAPLIPQNPAVALRGAAGAGIPVLAGCTAEEHRLYSSPSVLRDVPLSLPVLALRLAGPAVTHLLLRRPLRAVADARFAAGASTWMYEFTWRSPIHGLGAAHAMELPFVFDTLSSGESLTGPAPPQALADAMHQAWVRFATDGDPGWPAWNARRTVEAFGQTQAAGSR